MGGRVGDSETSWYVAEENDVAKRKELTTRVTVSLEERKKRWKMDSDVSFTGTNF